MLFSFLCLSSPWLTTDREQAAADLRSPHGENTSKSAFKLGACCQLALIFAVPPQLYLFLTTLT